MSENNILELFSSDMCRCCLTRNNLQNIHGNEIVDGEIVSLNTLFESVTDFSLKEDEKLPQCICSECASKLIDQFLFKKKCEKSLSLLHRVLNIPINKRQNERQCQTEFLSKETQTDSLQTVEMLIQTDDLFEIEEESESKESIMEIDQENSDDIELTIIDTGEENKYILEIDENTKSNDAQMYRCFYCKNQLNTSKELKNHLTEHIEIVSTILKSTNFYRCTRCRGMYPTAETFLDHIDDEDACGSDKIVDSDDKCVDYQFLADLMENLSIFSCQINDDNKFDCEFCENDFDEFNDFVDHFKSEHVDCEEMHEPIMNLSHRCGVCETKLENLLDTLFHVYFHQKQFKCSIQNCTNSYKKFAFLNRHLAREHFNQTAHKCNHCEFQTDTYELYKKHQRFDCKQRNYKCSYCDKTFMNKTSMIGHQRRIHLKLKSFECSVCEKTFGQSTDLKNHMRTHTDERPYQCNHCDKTFRTLGNKSDHMLTHGDGYEIECNICKKTFKNIRVLRGHKKLHFDGKKFECDICKKTFARKYHLTIHSQRVHIDKTNK